VNQKTLDIKPTLTKKQREALKILLDHNNGITELVFGGGAGGGKSYLGCVWIIINCLQYNDTRWLIGRSKLTNLKITTLKTFFEVAKSLGLKETTHYKYNAVNNIIKFKNGSEIILKDLATNPSDSDFDSLGSLEIAGAFIDECNQVSEKAKNVVMSRIRHKLDEYGLIPKLYMSCNPSKGWVYNEYYKKLKDGDIEPYKAFIQALVTDNKHISKHYITNLEKLDDISKHRLLLGEWEYSEVTALFDYDKLIEMFDEDDYKPKPIYDVIDNVYLTIDVARFGSDKTCVIVWDDKRIIDILDYTRTSLATQLSYIKKLIEKYNIKASNIAVDSDGVGGGIADFLPNCINIVNNSRPINNENFQNLKTQLYFKLAEVVNKGEIKIFNVKDEVKTKLIQELQILKREKIDIDGKICMTTKDQVKQMIGRSPDTSDSMAFRMFFEMKDTAFTYSFGVAG